MIEFKRLDINDVLNKDKIELIKGATIDTTSLKEVKERLPENITYAEIKWVLSSLGKLKTKKTQIEIAINTYIGNYCYRKCFKHPDIMMDCSKKFDRLVKDMQNNEIRFKEFKTMINNDDIKICKLPIKKRWNYVSWGRFEYLSKNGKDYWDVLK